jgi:hypothetical protein
MSYDWRPSGARTSTPAGGPAIPPTQEYGNPEMDTLPPDDVSVAAIVEEFVSAAELGAARNRTGRRYRPSALRDLRGILRNHVAGELGDLPLRDVQPEDVQALLDRLADEGLSVSRMRSVVSAVRALYAYAMEQGIVDASPADVLQVPREEPRPRTGEFGEEEAWDGDGPSMLHHAARLKDVAEDAWRDSAYIRERRTQRRESRGAEAPTPPAMMSGRILSLALRWLLVIFFIITLASLAQALLVPA